ncbi:MAG: response regulator [Anaerolineales bacterium]|nr:MAG: response regulator [Anaerolineales bacterium]
MAGVPRKSESMDSKETAPAHNPESKAIRIHRAFLAHLRHELLTPLNAIIGYSEMLLEEAEDEGLEALIPNLKKTCGAGKGLLALVNEILDPAKVEAGELDLDLETLEANLRHTLLTLVNAVIGYSEMLLEDAAEGEQEDFIPDLEKIHTAAMRFRVLINNVAHFSKIEAGKIDADLKTGATVSMIQDVVTAIRPLAAQKSGAEPAERGFVLVVDDNEMNRDVLACHLERQGHSVAVAENGLQALEMIKTYPFDLVLLDIMMPEMDGYQVLQRLKSHVPWRDIPVIMISALEEIDSVVRCIEMGAEDYLPKPFDPVLLRARTNASLEKKRLRDQEVEYLRNVALVTDAAAAVETQTFDPDSLAGVATRADALGQLARVFQGMAREVYAREQRLKQHVQELRIELDEAKQARRVAEITDTEYFQDLLSQADDIRRMFDETD